MERRCESISVYLLSQTTPYAPYIGHTVTLTLPHTIYGGTVDAVAGEGQETWKLVTLDGRKNGWYRASF